MRSGSLTPDRIIGFIETKGGLRPAARADAKANTKVRAEQTAR